MSTTDDKPGMGRCPSSQLHFLDSGDNVTALPDLTLFMNNLDLNLCVFLCLRSRLKLSEMIFIMGPREGNHADGDRNSFDVS